MPDQRGEKSLGSALGSRSAHHPSSGKVEHSSSNRFKPVCLNDLEQLVAAQRLPLQQRPDDGLYLGPALRDKLVHPRAEQRESRLDLFGAADQLLRRDLEVGLAVCQAGRRRRVIASRRGGPP